MKNFSLKSIHLYHAMFFSAAVPLLALLTVSCSKTEPVSGEVTVYSYDSFVSEWGPGDKIAKAFNEETGLTVNFVNCGSGVQVLSRAVSEKKNPVADVILGIDNNTAPKALAADILDSYSSREADAIINPILRAQLGTQNKLIPFDYSHFAIIFDTRCGLPEPKSLSDLTDPIYTKQLILMDPRTSTPGLGFVAWVRAIYKDDAAFDLFWQGLKPNVLTMAPGWSAGYGLFTKNEAPMVISYTTSPAANYEYDKINYYKALVFDEGHAMQVEAAGILKNAPNKKGARKFIDFLISEKAQSLLPLTQWMYPVNENVVLPESYKKAAAIPVRTVSASPDVMPDAVDRAVSILSK